MATTFAMTPEVARIREALDHPVIDGDGHVVEMITVVADLLADIADRDLANQLVGSARLASTRRRNKPLWGLPAENTLDHMTSQLPRLLYDRAEQLGLDFFVCYPSLGLTAVGVDDPEFRTALVRAQNMYMSEVFAPFRDRCEPVATISLVDPVEAVEELEFAVESLGFRMIVTNGAVMRREDPDGGPGPWVDAVGYNTVQDYDPFWRRCDELGVAPTFHGIGWGWGAHDSGNYAADHMGSFAASQAAVCRSLIMGGVATRFPNLRFAFLEGGITWAAQLLWDSIGHFTKRSREAIQQLNPARLDLERASSLFEEYATGRLVDKQSGWQQATTKIMERASRYSIDEVDDFDQSGIESTEDIVEMFRTQFFFGCEADDPMTALAYSQSMLPEGASLNAMFGSDIGHWDVLDMRNVLAEAWELVEDGHLTLEQFRDFTCGNAGRLVSAGRPAFFEGTAVGEDMATVLDGARPGREIP